MKLKLALCLISVLAISGCTRGTSSNSSRIRILLGGPGLGTLTDPIPAGYKACYGVNVTASDIPATPRSCGSDLGIFGGFVESGGTLEVMVPKGSNRKVDLYAYLTPNTSAPCPSLTATCESAKNCSTYKVATVSGVSMSSEQTEVNMTVDFPGLTSNSVAQESPASMLCAGNVAAALTSSGAIVDGSLAIIGSAQSSPALYTFYKRTSASSFDVVTRSQWGSESAGFVVKPQIRALSVDQGGGQLYGMISDGTLVTVSGDGDYAAIGSCPFATCSLPRWFKSFALGPGQKVFGLDHGGGLWRVDSASTLVPMTNLPPYVQQVVFQ